MKIIILYNSVHHNSVYNSTFDVKYFIYYLFEQQNIVRFYVTRSTIELSAQNLSFYSIRKTKDPPTRNPLIGRRHPR